MMFAKLKGLVTLKAPVALLALLCMVLLTTACSRSDFTDVEGNQFGWEDFQGRWLVINYWAEWCKPCAEEIPELNHLYRQGQDRDINVLGVNFDRPDMAELKRQIDALGVQFPVLYSDPDKQLDYLLPEVLPTTYIFNKEGKLAHKLVGPQTRASIEAHLTDTD